MDIETIFKIFAAIGAIIGAGKIIYELSSGGKLRLREEYRFAKEFLNDIEQTIKPHHLAIERGYYAIAGTSSIKTSEIAYLISLSTPDKCLKDYVLSRRYVELDEKHHKIVFRKKYKTSWSRNWRKGFYITIYVLAALLAMSPLLLAAPFNLGQKFIPLAFLTIPCFGFFAFDSLRGCIKIFRGETLVKEQEKHAQLIIVKDETKKKS